MVLAARCKSFGAKINLVIEDVDLPDPAPDEVRIRVHAAGVNFADVLMRTGKYQETPPLPFTPGIESAGIVEAVGADVRRVAPGDRVMAQHAVPGAFAQSTIVKVHEVTQIPEELSFEKAAAMQITYGTGHVALKVAGAEAGETILVNAAAGGVGHTAVEIAHLMGLTVIGTAGGADKVARVAATGAAAIDYKTEDVRTRVKELTGGTGVDLVYDPVGGELFNQSMRATRAGGRLIVIGFASGEVQQIPANILLVKNLTVHGFYHGGLWRMKPKLVRESLSEIVQWAVEGRIDPSPSRVYPFRNINKALDDLAGRKSTGKLVISMVDG